MYSRCGYVWANGGNGDEMYVKNIQSISVHGHTSALPLF